MKCYAVIRVKLLNLEERISEKFYFLLNDVGFITL